MASFSERTEEGSTVGQWFSNGEGTMGLIAQDGVPPYVCFYPDPIKGGVLPHAIFVKDGDLQIQVPMLHGGARYLSVNKILDHLAESCECECDHPVEAPKPE